MLTTILIAALVAATAPAEIPPFLQPFIWPVVAVVLTFGLGAAVVWLHARAQQASNPAVKAALNQLADLLQAGQGAVGPNGQGAKELADAAAAFFHAHTVITGDAHPADPRAPK